LEQLKDCGGSVQTREPPERLPTGSVGTWERGKEVKGRKVTTCTNYDSICCSSWIDGSGSIDRGCVVPRRGCNSIPVAADENSSPSRTRQKLVQNDITLLGASKAIKKI
jgi:hypothetical protein